MVDLTRDQHGRVRARLLDLVPGRSGKAYADWLTARGEEFRGGIKVAALDPFHGYKTAIADQLEDAVAVLDAFHVVKLGTAAVDECRRRVQQETTGHRGRKSDPLYGIQKLLRAGAEKLTDKQWTRLEKAIAARPEEHLQVWTAWSCAQQLRAAYRHHDPAAGRKIAEKILTSFNPLPGDRQQEREADEFAAELLTPRAEIEPLLPRTMRVAALEKLSAEWGVSVESLVRRMGELRVVSDLSVRRAYQRLSAAAEFRRDEPISTYKGEVPSLLREALDLAEQHGLTRRDLAVELCWTASHLREVLGEEDSRPVLRIVR